VKNKPYESWENVKKELNISKEQEAEIQLEMDLIKAVISARKTNNLSQRDLSEKTGIKQPVIARIESSTNSPKANTLIKLLYPLGYTLKVVPLDEVEKD